MTTPPQFKVMRKVASVAVEDHRGRGHNAMVPKYRCTLTCGHVVIKPFYSNVETRRPAPKPKRSRCPECGKSLEARQTSIYERPGMPEEPKPRAVMA
jgi:hypothetical protein